MAKHPHKYIKIPLGNDTEVYKCMKPNCTHYMPKYLETTLIGRSAECVDCGELFTIQILGSNKLICNECKFGMIEKIVNQSIE